MVMLFNDEETVALPEGVHLEHMSVMTVRARGSKASWKVLAGDQIIGRLDRWTIVFVDARIKPVQH